LYRQQYEKDKQNIKFARHENVSADDRASDLNFFKILAFFPTCFGCFLPANTTNKNI